MGLVDRRPVVCPTLAMGFWVPLHSSIPIEYRNRTFKVRLKNNMRGWCLKKPRVTRRGMAHVVNTDELAVGVQLRKAKGGQGEALLARKRRRCE